MTRDEEPCTLSFDELTVWRTELPNVQFAVLPPGNTRPNWGFRSLRNTRTSGSTIQYRPPGFDGRDQGGGAGCGGGGQCKIRLPDCREIIPVMALVQGGSIINTQYSFGLGRGGGVRTAAYCASKAAVVLMTKPWPLTTGGRIFA
jgi:hypothetical protein